MDLNLTPIEENVDELTALRRKIAQAETANKVAEENTLTKVWTKIREAWARGEKIKVTEVEKSFEMETAIFCEAMELQYRKRLNDMVDVERVDPFHYL